MWGGLAALPSVVRGWPSSRSSSGRASAVAGTDIDTGQPASKISAHLGFAAAGLVILKFIFAVTNEPAFGAFIGPILALGVAYGAWMRFQEPAAMPASPTSGGLA